MKVMFTVVSIGLMWISIVRSPELDSFFSNLIVFFAMYCVSYFENKGIYNQAFLRVIKNIMFGLVAVCFIGWAGLIELVHENGQVFLAIDTAMRLGDVNLINIHIFFLLLAGFVFIISICESVFRIANEEVSPNSDLNVEEVK